MRYCLLAIVLLIAGCLGVPEGIEPVKHFEINRYLGRWYEIARLDHSFERGLQQVTAEYRLSDDGGITVINRGFNSTINEWREAVGKAYFVDDEQTGYLKVSFFGPFYGAYVVFELADDYQYSLITSSDKSYFWLLSRTPVIDEAVKQHIIKRLVGLGFATQKLIFVEQAAAINNSGGQVNE